MDVLKILKEPIKAGPAVADIVFVPGLDQSSDCTCVCKDDGSLEPEWLEDLVNDVPNFRLLCYNAPSGGVICRQSIRQDAARLISSLSASRTDISTNPLVFIGHGLGNLLVKEVLVTAAYESEDAHKAIFSSTKAMVFVSPSSNIAVKSGSSLQNYPVTHSGLLERRLASLAADINRDFIDTKLPLRISTVDAAIGQDHQEQIPFTLLHRRTRYTRLNPAPCISVSVDTALGIPFSIYQQGIRYRLRFTEELFKVDISWNVSHPVAGKDLSWQDALWSQAAPQYPLPHLPEELEDAIFEQRMGAVPSKTFWGRGRQIDITWIQDGSAAVQTAAAIFSCTRRKVATEEDIVFFFELDYSINTVEAMLSTFLAGMKVQWPKYWPALSYRFASTDESRLGVWSQEDLLVLLHDTILSIDTWRDGSMRLIWVLANADPRMQGFDWFLRAIETGADLPFKLIITSPAPSILTGVSFSATPGEAKTSSCPVSDLAPKTSVAEDQSGPLPLSEDLLDLMLDAPQLQMLSSARKIESLLDQCGQDRDLREMVIASFRCKNLSRELSDADVDEDVSGLSPITPQGVFRFALTAVLGQFTPLDGQILELLQLLIYSFRPLRLPELQYLVQVVSLVPDDGHGRLSAKFASSLDGWLGPLLTVRGNSIIFRHLMLRDFLASPNAAMGHSDLSPEKAHANIARLCFEYACTKTGRERMLQYRRSQQPYTELGLDFASYAGRFWLRHLCAGDTASEPISDFVDDSLLQLWAEIHWLQSNPVTRSKTLPMSSLPYLAEHGVVALFNQVKDGLAGLPQYDSECMSALVSVARSSTSLQNPNIVDDLLSAVRCSSLVADGDGMSAVVLAALDAGHPAFAEQAITLAREAKADIQFRDLIAHRAAFLRHNDIVKLLVHRETPYEESHVIPMQDQTLLYSACVGGNTDTVELCIKKYVDSLDNGDAEATAVQLACKYGSRSAARRLVERSIMRRAELAEAPAGIVGATEIADSPDTEDGDNRGSPKPPRVPEIDSWIEGADRYKRLEVFELAVNSSIRSGQVQTLRELLGLVDGGDDGPSPELAAFLAAQQRRKGCFVEGIRQLQPSESALGVVALAAHASVERLDAEMVQMLFQVQGAGSKFSYSQGLRDLLRWRRPAVPASVVIIDCICAEAKKHMPGPEYDALLNSAFWLAFDSWQKEYPEDMGPIVACLIRNGADVNAKNFEQLTALWVAVYRDHEQKVSLLLENKADTSITCSPELWTVVHVAFSNDMIMKLLLETENAPINALNSDGCTALYFASEWGHLEVVELLLERNAELEHGRIEDNQTALEVALAAGQYDVAIRLLDAGASWSPKAGNNLAQHCAEEGGKAVWEKLLLHNWDLGAKDKNGDTALHCACANDDVNIARLLVNRGAPLDVVNDFGLTPLAAAAEQNNGPVVEFLLSRNAEVNLVDKQTTGSLHAACSSASPGVVRMLCQKGANPNLEDLASFGTPLQLALSRPESCEKDEILTYLLDECQVKVNQKSSWWGGALYLACLDASIEMTRRLIEKHNATVVMYDSMKRQPIHFALYRDREHADLLCKHGADFLSKDALGRTALHWAVTSGHVELVELVAEKHPDQLNARDVDGWTPLMWALRIPDLQRMEKKLATKVDQMDDDVNKSADGVHEESSDKNDDNDDDDDENEDEDEDKDEDKDEDEDEDEVEDEDKDEDEDEDSDEIDENTKKAITKQMTPIVRALLRRSPSTKLARSKDLEIPWTALKLSKYYGLGKDIVDLLEPKPEELASLQASDEEFWSNPDNNFAAAAKGFSSGFCDACLMALVGEYHLCVECEINNIGFCLCFKCFASKEAVHSPNHTYDRINSSSGVTGKDRNSNSEDTDEDRGSNSDNTGEDWFNDSEDSGGD